MPFSAGDAGLGWVELPQDTQAIPPAINQPWRWSMGIQSL
jgi:hypothetical protein